jgi:hypothetical protein
VENPKPAIVAFAYNAGASTFAITSVIEFALAAQKPKAQVIHQ